MTKLSREEMRVATCLGVSLGLTLIVVLDLIIGGLITLVWNLVLVPALGIAAIPYLAGVALWLVLKMIAGLFRPRNK